DRGAVHAHDAGTGEQVWKQTLNGKVRGMAVSDGRLILSTEEGQILCFGSGADGTAARNHQEPVESKTTNEDDKVLQWILKTLSDANINRGYAVIVGDPKASLTRTLVNRTELRAIVIARDAAERDSLRRQLTEKTAWHGYRISVFTQKRLKDLPHYFANVVVTLGKPSQDLLRALHPYSGRLFLPGVKIEEVEKAETGDRCASVSWLSSPHGTLGLAGPIPEKQRGIQTPLEMLWFGGPGPNRMTDRHVVDSPRPKAANGRYFVIGEHHVIAVNAFNGVELWSIPLRNACVRDREIRTSTRNIASSAVSMHIGKDVLRLNLGAGVHMELDAQIGNFIRYYGLRSAEKKFGLKKQRSFPIPYSTSETENPKKIGLGDFGSVKLKPTEDALEIELTANHPGGRLLDRWELFFDFRRTDSRFGLYDRGAFHLTVFPHTAHSRGDVNVLYKYFPRWQSRVPRPKHGETAVRKAEVIPGAGPVHPASQIEGVRNDKSSVTTIRLAWSSLEELTGQMPKSFGFAASLLLDDPEKEPVELGRLFCDESASRINNGWATFDLESETDTAISLKLYENVVWPSAKMPKIEDVPSPSKDLAYKSFPPYRTHPLTGRPSRRIFRPAYGCAAPVSVGDLTFFRSGSLAYYDYRDDSGVRNIFGARPGCQDNPSILPAMGIVVCSERSSGCSCNYNFQTSLALVPAKERRNEDWAVYYEHPAEHSIRSMNLNFGVPGDRRDEQANLWLAYPRPWSRSRPSLVIPVQVECEEGMGPYRFNSDIRVVKGTDRPWLYASGHRGIKHITVQTGPASSAVALPTGAPTIDGRLNEACWDQTKKEQALRLQFHTPSTYYREYWDGMRKTERQTDWCLLRHDKENLYLAFFDTPRPDRKG
ncbi:MAG: PQQ-binding-like beta-propeller repeat protein, partial [Planctomycetota bacterium]|nr:PQQ-binding-like beta-propeller repeat protein [Planctomycetota bacterium]